MRARARFVQGKRRASVTATSFCLSLLLAVRVQAQETEATFEAAETTTDEETEATFEAAEITTDEGMGTSAEVEAELRHRSLTGFAAIDRPTGMAEFGVGWLTLPNAEVCVSRTGAGCSRGDTSLVLDAWQLFRLNLRIAFGAGITLGLIPTTDAPREDPAGIQRDHTRRYFTVEGTARYYFYVEETFEAWTGVNGGLVVVSDTFSTAEEQLDRALVGPRGITIRTEGYSIGLGAGVAFQVAEHWSLGAGLRLGNWFLPSEPEVNPFGDEASLTGRNLMFSGGINVAYRTTL